jgi:integrase
MSSIQKIQNSKGSSYRVYIRRKGIKTITKTFLTKKLAKDFSLKVESSRNMQLAYSGHNNKTNFSDLVEDYLINSYTGKRPKEQRGRLNYWLILFADMRIIDISNRDVANGIRSLPTDLSNATKNRYKAAISVVFSYACREYDLPDNPVRHIRSLTESRGRTRYLSDDERSRLFEVVRRSNWDKLYLLVLLAITTGARKSELTSLKWSDVDFDRQIAYISTTKNGEPKLLPLTEAVVTELKQFSKQDNSLVFDSVIKPGRAYCFTKPWKKALNEAGIEDFTFHSLRHTCASYLAMNGASLLEIADVLGHKQIQMTKRYSHLCIDHKQKLINNVLGGINLAD